MADPYPQIAQRLRQARIAKGLTQSDLAIQAGSTREYLCRLENGRSRPNLLVLEGLCKVLGVPLSWLLEGTEEFAIPSSLDEKNAVDPVELLHSLTPINRQLAEDFLVLLCQWQQMGRSVDLPWTAIQDASKKEYH